MKTDEFNHKDYNEHFQLITTSKLAEVAQIREAFRKKRELEKIFVEKIKQFEEETGLAIDMIKYQRDITLPIRGPRYTSLSIIITAEEDRKE